MLYDRKWIHDIKNSNFAWGECWAINSDGIKRPVDDNDVGSLKGFSFKCVVEFNLGQNGFLIIIFYNLFLFLSILFAREDFTSTKLLEINLYTVNSKNCILFYFSLSVFNIVICWHLD